MNRRPTRRQLIAGTAGVGATGLLGTTLGHQWLVADGDFDPPTRFGERAGTRIGVIGDPHWTPDGRGRAKGIGSSAIVKASELKRNLDIIAADMQTQFESDLVVQIGDLADGFGTWDHQRECLHDAKAYIETEANGSGLENVHHLPGNHEYKLVPVDDRQDMYDVFGWDGIGDTFRHIEIGNLNILLLNTAFSPTHSRESVKDHTAPQAQLDWLDEIDIEGPVVAFSHIGLTECSGSVYDTVAGKAQLLDRLHEFDFRLGVFGHSHHADDWDQVRVQHDAWGTPHVHVPTPNLYKPTSGKTMFDDVLHVDYKTVPYLKLEVAGDGAFRACASYEAGPCLTPS